MQGTPLAGPAKSNVARAPKLAPVTLAIRSALAASVAIALAGPAAAGVQARTVPAPIIAVHDLTRVAAAAQTPTADDTVVDNDAAISVATTGDAVALSAYSAAHGAFVTNTGAIDLATDGVGIGILSVAAGYASIDNGAAVTVSGGQGIGLYAAGASVGVNNSGDIEAVGTYTDATGIAAIATDAATVTNSGTIRAASAYGTADGIFATGTTVDVSNAGDIVAQGLTWAAGIEAQGDDSATVTNIGTIDASVTGYGEAFAIYATGGTGSVSVSNSGLLSANGYYATGIEIAAGTDAYVLNDGAINAGVDGAAVATGIHATSQYDGGAVTVINNGDIVAAAQYIATGIEVVASGVGSTAEVTNAGTVTVRTYANYTTTGIAVSADGDSTVTNLGSVYAAGGGDTDGIVATTFGGTASVVNSGDVVAASSNGYANGLVADAAGGIATVSNQGTVAAYSGYVGIGVQAQGLYGATVDNDGVIYSRATYAYGVRALSGQGDVAITNGTDGQVIAYGALGVGAFGVATQGDVTLDNAGLLAGVGVYSSGFGAFLRANEGDVAVSNSGSLQGVSYYGATALRAIADAGDVAVVNDGDVLASAGNGAAKGMAITAYGTASVTNNGGLQAVSTAGNAYAVSASAATIGVVNNGDIVADAVQGYGVGVLANGGDVTLANAGNIDASGVAGIGLYAIGTTSANLLNTGTVVASGTDATGLVGLGQASVAIENRGVVDVNGDAVAAGFAIQSNGDASLLNSGDVTVVSASDARGVQAVVYGDVVLENRSGTLEVSGTDAALGMYAYAGGAATLINGDELTVDSTSGAALGIVANGLSTVDVRNSGVLTVDGAAGAAGILASGYGATSVLNTGTIDASSASEALGIGIVSGSEATVDNRGTITASSDTSAVAVDFVGAGTLSNTGTLQAVSEGTALAVRGDAGIQDIRNGGTILSAIATGADNDLFTNATGGNWFVDDAATDFGDGDDVLTNASGGTITLRGGAIHLGSGFEGNTFDNLGTVRVQGTGLVDMGTGADGTTPNALAFSNTGLIDMLDGATDDVLTLQGDLGGTGRLAIDMAADGTATDRLVVDGNVAEGAQQVVDLQFTGLPTPGMTPVAFASVTGTSTADAFVGGSVLGYDARDFLDLRVAVNSDIAASNATPDVFYVGLDVAGLNAAGTLAANVAAGAHSMMASHIGSWRERMGMDPSYDGRAGLGGWVRAFADRGRLSPTNSGITMGSAGDLRFDQDSHGHEFGADAHFGRGLHAGLTLGESDGTQKLRDGGGSDRLHAGASGTYVSWFGANGTYVDVSYRWLAFDARIDTAAGLQHARGDGHAFNVEAGLGGWSLGGFRAVPQVQFTQSRIGGLDIEGASATFTSHGSTSNRGRVGLEFSRDVALGAWSLTPYGAVSAVREFNGRSRYSVNGAFDGETSTEGTSAKVDLGVAAQFRGVVLGAGVQWTDGGALEDFVGGQLVARYTW